MKNNHLIGRYQWCIAFFFTLISVSAMAQQQQRPAQPPFPGCAIEIYDIQTKQRKVLHKFTERVEAPNWSVDGKYLVYNSGGKLYKIDVATGNKIEEINTGYATSCNNDHVLSADGKFIAISHGTREDRRSRVYTVPVQGGTPRLITPLGPSYLHGISPDGKQLAYCAERNGNFDVYVIPVEGGVETRLTDVDGLDDGPEYSPDGKHIWFNSVRTGLMQSWRMNVDGSEQTQMTFDENLNTWFPHISPDGKLVVAIAYRKGDVAPGDHPGGKEVALRLFPATGGTPETIVELYGGQGTLNVNSWSPDSKKFAFVSFVRP